MCRMLLRRMSRTYLWTSRGFRLPKLGSSDIMIRGTWLSGSYSLGELFRSKSFYCRHEWKWETILLKGRLPAVRPPIVRVNGLGVWYRTQIKYLGLIISERMCFTSYLEGMKEKVQAIIGKVRSILRSDWGLDVMLCITYHGLFLACPTYGASVWWELATTVGGRLKLPSVQRCMMFAYLPVCRIGSTDATQVLLVRRLLT